MSQQQAFNIEYELGQIAAGIKFIREDIAELKEMQRKLTDKHDAVEKRVTALEAEIHTGKRNLRWVGAAIAFFVSLVFKLLDWWF